MPRLFAASGVCAVLALLVTAAPALAQGRVSGVVRDTGGRPIKGATIKAFNEEAFPREVTSTTDDKGRWAMLGLRVSPNPNWRFTIEAPGYFPAEGVVSVRSTPGQPMNSTLVRDPGPLPGALAKDIGRQLSAAAALRDEGRYDEAISAYEAIQSKNEKLTSLNLVLAGVFRAKAQTTADRDVRRALLERAVSAYGEVLKTDADNPLARTEMAATQASLLELQ